MSLYSYLADGLLEVGNMRDLSAQAQTIAVAWIECGVDPATVEILSELVARTAAALGEERMDLEQLREAASWLPLREPVWQLVAAAMPEPLGATSLAALAVHLVDVGERAALKVFVPELPSLQAKSDRSGDAARRVGTARHLRG